MSLNSVNILIPLLLLTVLIIILAIIGTIAGPSNRFIISYGGALYTDFTSKDHQNYFLED